MKIQTILFIAATAMITACNNDDDGDGIPEQPAGETPSYFTGTSGSYWVYDTYLVEASGEEVISSNDTVFATGDTLIGGNTYGKFWYSAPFNGRPPNEAYSRDSSGYIVGPTGTIRMSYVNFEDELFFLDHSPDSGDFMITQSDQMEQFEGDVVLPAGTFSDVINRKSTFVAVQNGDTIVYAANNLYAPEIGQITSTYLFAMQLLSGSETYYEHRLVDYHIATP